MDTPSSHFVGVAGVLAAGATVVLPRLKSANPGARRRRAGGKLY